MERRGDITSPYGICGKEIILQNPTRVGRQVRELFAIYSFPLLFVSGVSSEQLKTPEEPQVRKSVS